MAQFENGLNWRTHLMTTGPELVRDFTEKKSSSNLSVESLETRVTGLIDAFVSGAGTGGTVAGVSMYLKGIPAGPSSHRGIPKGVSHKVCVAL